MQIGKELNLSYKTVVEQGYLNNGLVALWDGIDNSGNGIHSKDLIEWVDCIKGFRLQAIFPAGPGYILTYDDSVLLSKVAFSSDIPMLNRIFSSKNVTVELCISYNKLNPSSDPESIFTRSSDRLLFVGTKDFTVKFNAKNYAQIMAFGGKPSADWIYVSGKMPHVISVSVDSLKSRIYRNAKIVEEFNTGLTSYDSLFTGIGGTYSEVTVYCVRVYNRPLSQFEIDFNRNVDYKRFGIGYDQ